MTIALQVEKGLKSSWSQWSKNKTNVFSAGLDWVGFNAPCTRHSIGHFGGGLHSQSLDCYWQTNNKEKLSINQKNTHINTIQYFEQFGRLWMVTSRTLRSLEGTTFEVRTIQCNLNVFSSFGKLENSKKWVRPFWQVACGASDYRVMH